MVDLDDVFFLAADDGDHPHRTLSLTRAPTVLLVFAANRFTRSAARLYQKRYGIGAMDWRMLVMLTREPDIPVSRAAQVIGIDKAAVSRSLARLEEMQLAECEAPGSNPRRRLWRLTEKGYALHDEVLNVAMARQKKILEGFSRDDVLKFNTLLSLFMRNVENLDNETR